MNQGFIALHRKFLDWEWYDDINTKTLFIHCLIKSNFKEKAWRGQKIERGSFLTSYQILADETGLTVQNIRTSIKKLENTGELTRKSTSKLTKITLCKYDVYQNSETTTNKQANISLTSDQQATNKQLTTTNKDNKETKRIIKRTIKRFTPPQKTDVIQFFEDNGYTKESGEKAFLYYSEADWADSKGNMVKNWKQKMRGVWFKDENKIASTKPTGFQFATEETYKR